jgi:hypothetical protein
MPIIERTPKDCFDVFATHVRGLVAATISPRFPVAEIPHETRMTLSFRESAPIAVPIDTQYGRLFFYLGQALEALPEDDRYRLTTRQYWYRLQTGPSLQEQAILRWEYSSATDPARHARHHAQIGTSLEIGGHEFDLDKAHLRTGWVTFEEVIRFLIFDLGMEPPCGDGWPELLSDSEKRFFEDFTGKRHRPDVEPQSGQA